MNGDPNNIPNEWYFITPPQEVMWKKSSEASEITTYGTNNPYYNYGSTKLRSLSLGQAMIEGFSVGKEVDADIKNLEMCMQMVLDTETGFASPYCWNVFAGGKSYGTYIIKSVDLREEMRDATGKATRAFADIELQEVSPYQVSSGTDITSEAIVGGIDPEFESELAKQDGKVGKDNGSGPGSSNPGSSNPGSSDPSNPGGEGETPPGDPVVPIDPSTTTPIFSKRGS